MSPSTAARAADAPGMFAACLAREALGLSGDEALAWIRELVPGAVETRGQERPRAETYPARRVDSLSSFPALQPRGMLASDRGRCIR